MTTPTRITRAEIEAIITRQADRVVRKMVAEERRKAAKAHRAAVQHAAKAARQHSARVAKSAEVGVLLEKAGELRRLLERMQRR